MVAGLSLLTDINPPYNIAVNHNRRLALRDEQTGHFHIMRRLHQFMLPSRICPYSEQNCLSNFLIQCADFIAFDKFMSSDSRKQ